MPCVTSFGLVITAAAIVCAADASYCPTSTPHRVAKLYYMVESHAKAETAIRAILTEYLNAHPACRPDARVRVARVTDRGKARVSVVGVAALVGAKRSDAKARASRANGRLGGRPSKDATTRTTRTKASR